MSGRALRARPGSGVDEWGELLDCHPVSTFVERTVVWGHAASGQQWEDLTMASSGPNRYVSHYLAGIGQLKIQLHNESRVLYDHLLQVDEINRLHSLSQLGYVDEAWRMARHTRWDFTMLLLDLIDHCKELPKMHVNSHVDLNDGVSISSSRELMICWALLLNLGHLHGTFASEGELMFALKGTGAGKAHVPSLLDGIPEDARPFAKGVLLREDLYRFYQVLAFFRLRTIATRKMPIALWEQMLLSLVYERPNDREALQRARMAFRSMRRLAFLTLDSSSTPGPLKIAYSEVRSSPAVLQEILLESRDASRRSVFDDLEEYLNRSIYVGAPVLAALAALRPQLRSEIRQRLNTLSFAEIVEYLAKSQVRASRIRRSRTRIAVRCEVLPPVPFVTLTGGTRTVLNKRRMEASFDKWSALCGTKASMLVTSDAAGRHLIFQTHAHRHYPINFATAIVGAISTCARVHRHLRLGLERLGLPEQVIDADRIMADSVQSIIFASLTQCFPNVGHWEAGDRNDTPIFLIGRRRELLQAMERRVAEPSLSKSKHHEMESLTQLIRRFPVRSMLLSVTPIVGYDRHTRGSVVEFDCVIVGSSSTKKELILCVGEAKSTKGARARSQSDLKNKFQKLRVRKDSRVGLIRVDGSARRAVAWRYVRAPYAQ
jgi:hypothetical protein